MQRVPGKCKTEGCPKLDMGGGHCMAHGGGRSCQAEGYRKLAVGRGYCIAHGGGLNRSVVQLKSILSDEIFKS